MSAAGQESVPTAAVYESSDVHPSATVHESQTDKGQFSDGIMSVLAPVIQQLDASVKSTRQSQIHLRTQIDSLAEDLRVISDAHDGSSGGGGGGGGSNGSGMELDGYVRKLQDSKKRVAVVSSILQNTQDRIVRLQSNVAKETAKRKAALEQPNAVPPPSAANLTASSTTANAAAAAAAGGRSSASPTN